MKDFWESMFREEKTTWGFEASDSAILSKDFFLKKNAKEVLIPRIGYGRNAKIFRENGLNVFFYDTDSVKREFGQFGLEELIEIDEPIKHMENKPPLKMIFVKCQKN